MSTTATLDAALDLHDHGCSVVPVRADGTKAPLGNWRDYQQERANRDAVRSWFGGGRPGVGIITGAVSGNLEMLELEGRAVAEGVLEQLGDILDASGLGDLWQRITTGWTEQSPSGGVHFHYRVADAPVAGNTKLARRPARDDELTDDERRVLETKPNKIFIRDLIETRGEGGFVVVAPSHGPVHPTGRPWARVAGGPATVPTITADEYDALHTVCTMLNQPTTAAPTPAPAGRIDLDDQAAFFGDTPQRTAAGGGLSPGDDYEQRTDWADILTPHGWTLVAQHGRTRYWRRPGKTIGVSATTGHADDRDRLYVFTSSTEFDQERPYTKFGAVAVLDHGGDHSAAARALRHAGYGQPAPEPSRRHLTAVPDPRPPVDGTAALQVDEPEPAPGPAFYSRTDDGNALRLVDAHEQEIRYCPQRGWLVWDGHRWSWDQVGRVYELARAIARDLPNGEGEAQHKAKSLSARGLESMVKVARTDPRIVTPIAALDAEPWQLNTPGGVVDLRTATITAPDPASLHTRSTLVEPDFERPAERWTQFLMATFGGDYDLIAYVHRLLGLSLVGEVLEQILPFAFGDGANGKSTLADTVMRIVGIGETGYAISAPSEMLLASAANSHPTEIARLAGARLVVASELDDDQRFAEARIKMLTGSDVITGRFMRQDFFSFSPTHTLWLLGNHQPAVRTGGPAFWRRLRLVPFLNTVPEAQRDVHLESKLVDGEGPSILAWLIRGASAYVRLGLPTPASVATATSSYAADQDTVTRFVTEMCTLGDPTQQQMRVTSTALRAAYERWCQQEGEEPVSAKKFAGQLKKAPLNVQTERTRTHRYFAGIRLNGAHTDSEAR